MYIHLPVLYTCLSSVDNGQNNLNFAHLIFHVCEVPLTDESEFNTKELWEATEIFLLIILKLIHRFYNNHELYKGALCDFMCHIISLIL